MSDQLALGVLDGTTRQVPTELAVTGWDDSPAAPMLTTVAQSLRDQGRACALLALGEDPGPPPTWTVTTRRSTR